MEKEPIRILEFPTGRDRIVRVVNFYVGTSFKGEPMALVKTLGCNYESYRIYRKNLKQLTKDELNTMELLYGNN